MKKWMVALLALAALAGPTVAIATRPNTLGDHTFWLERPPTYKDPTEDGTGVPIVTFKVGDHRCVALNAAALQCWREK